MDSFIREYNSTYLTYGDKVELEVKFGEFKLNNRGYTNFVSQVSPQVFKSFDKRLKEQIKNVNSRLYKFKFKEMVKDETIVTLYPGDVRVINSTTNSTTITQKKTRVKDLELQDYGIRFSISLEELYTDRLPEPNGKRERSRTSYIFESFTIDLTQVSFMTNNNMIITYEVEVEYNSGDVLEFINNVQVVYAEFKNTLYIYTNSNKDSVERFLLSYGIDKKYLVQARNLKKADIVNGGIVNNKICNYYLTYKADGVRCLLVIHSTGVWLIFPPFEYNLIQFNTKDLPLNVVVDGELITTYLNGGLSYRYFMFDCLLDNGRDITHNNYIERMNTPVKLLNYNFNNITLTVKETQLITLDNIWDLFTYFLNGKAALDYQQDGLMIIPGGKYNYYSDKLPANKRILTLNPDVCKFKDIKDITIDFMIVKGSEGIVLMNYDYKEGKNVVFKGSSINPVTPDMIDSSHPLTKDLPTGSIVEYMFENGKFTPIRIRTDKTGSNTLMVAESNWKDINDPLTDKDMMGLTLTFVYKYHNRIKIALINYLKAKGCKVLLDFGTGNGGDLPKMRGFTVIAVEPNATNAKELERRIQIYNFEDIYTLIMGAEDPKVLEFLNNNKVDCITMMLSLSFFWQSKEKLNALVKNIAASLRSGGTFAFITIDGNNLLSSLDQNGILKANSAEFKVSNNEVKVSLPGTIVGEQTEWLVFIKDLELRLRPYGFKLIEYHRADKEALLSKPAMVYSSLYTYGYFERN